MVSAVLPPILQVNLGPCSRPVLSDWCPVTNLVAISCDRVEPAGQRLSLVAPEVPHERVDLFVPLAGSDEKVFALCWSAADCLRALLSVTTAGRIIVWARSPQSRDKIRFRSVDDWHGSQVAVLSEQCVFAAWLQQPSCWQWRSEVIVGPFFQDQNIESSFFSDSHVVEGHWHWVRPAVMPFVVVTTARRVHVWWTQLGPFVFNWRSTEALVLPGESDVTLLDLKTWQQGTLVCAYCLAGSEDKVRVALLRGDPTLAAAAPDGHPGRCTFDQVDVLSLDRGRRASQIHVDTSTSSLTLYIVSSLSGASFSLHRFSAKQDKGMKFDESRLSLPVAAAASSSPRSGRKLDVTPQECPQRGLVSAHWSKDGSHVSFSCGSKLQILPTCALTDRAEDAAFSLQNVMFPSLLSERCCSAVCFAPNTFCVGALLTDVDKAHTGDGQLLLWTVQCPIRSLEASLLPDSDKAAGSEALPALAKIAAYRLAWCCVHDHCGWDVLQIVKRIMIDERTTVTVHKASEQDHAEALMAKILEQVDVLVHNFPHTPRPNYHMRWDRLKLHVAYLLDSQDGQVLQVDIGTRAVVHRLFCIVSQFEGLVNEVYGALHNRKESAKAQAQQLVAILAPWLQWAQKFNCVFLRCFKTWISRRQDGHVARAVADRIPLVRLLPDEYFHRRFAVVLQMFRMVQRMGQTCGATSHASEHEPDLEQTEKMYKQLMDHFFRPVSDPKEATAGKTYSRKEIEEHAFPVLVRTAQEMFSGSFRLHYCRTSGAQTWPLNGVEELDKIQSFKELRTLEDKEMQTELKSLGLCLEAAPRFLVNVLAQHLKFRNCPGKHRSLALFDKEASATASTASMDSDAQGVKDRWREQRRSAFLWSQGLLLPKEHALDVLSGKRLARSSRWSHRSLDGSAVAEEFNLSGASAGTSGAVAALSLHDHRAWLCASPLTASPWKRMRMDIDA